jgi:hypothetical protein
MGEGAAGRRVKPPLNTRTGTALPFIISELPGERAEALFIAMAALVPTAGEHSEIQFDEVGAPEPRVMLTYLGRTAP